MERNRFITGQYELECPMMCGCVLFAVICMFILYWPLGDPYSIECSDSQTNTLYYTPVCCICSVYMLLIKTVYNIIEIAETIFSAILNALCEVKIRILAACEYITKCTPCEKNQNDTTSTTETGETTDGKRKEATKKKSEKCPFFKNCFKSQPDGNEDEKKSVTKEDVKSDKKLTPSFFKFKSTKTSTCPKCEENGNVCPSECTIHKK